MINRMGIEQYLATLSPTTAKRVRLAQEVETVRYPVASKGLTLALGGGVGAGRIATFYGNQSSGKSMLWLQTIGMLQKQGLVCAYGDAEMAYDKDFAAKLGVNNDELILIQKRSFGAMADTIAPHLQAGIDVLVIDSISALQPDVFLDDDGNLEEFAKRKQMAAHAKSCTIFTNGIHYDNEKTAVIFISQTTTGIYQTHTQQMPHGGQKVLFNSSQIVRLTSSATEKNQIKSNVTLGNKIIEQPIGRPVDVTVEKNKLGPQSRKTKYNIYYDGPQLGIDLIGEIAELAIAYGIVEGSTWLSYEGQKWQGKANLVTALKEDDVLRVSMTKRLDDALV